MLGGIGATAAWLIGGPLVDGPGWEWIFFINIPVGLAALALSPVLLRESRATVTRRSYDPAGALTITGALALLVYAIVEAPNTGWGDVQTILLLARDRKSTRLNSSHLGISYAVFCLKKKI